MNANEALWVGLWLGGAIVLTLEHLAFPAGLWVASRLSRRARSVSNR